MNKKTLLGTGLLLAGLAGPLHAVDGMSIELGSGDGTDMGRVGLQWDWGKRWFQGRQWHLGGYWDLSLGHWRRQNVVAGQNQEITEIGLTPVFRLQQNDLRGVYAEAGIGFHLMSNSSIGDRRMSTLFQFGDHLRLGVRFGGKGEYDLSYRFQHLSNASIKRPNPGINFNQIRFQYHF